ncbi:hypothetical protein A9W96_11000 [Mycobacterium sp. 1245852.3]|nr:hypothetical protein A9W96_11000 [Mycobacterium sp. 1245852.3]
MDFAQRHSSYAGSGQLHSSGKAGKPSTQLIDDVLVLIGQWGAADLANARREQIGRIGGRQRRHPPHHLLSCADRLGTSDHDSQGRPSVAQGSYELLAAAQYVSGVIEHRHHFSITDRVDQRVDR